MSEASASKARIGRVLMLAMLMAGVMCGECAGQDGLRPQRQSVSQLRPSNRAPATPQPSPAGAMRYYGGPKSPMWRG